MKIKPLTQGELARAWNVTRPIITRWVKLGMPLTSMEEASAWRQQRAEDTNRSPHIHTSRELKDRLALAQARLAEIKVDKELGKMVTREEVNSLFAAIAQSQKALLFARVERELPQRLAGLEVPKMRTICRDIADEICEVMRRKIEEWQPNE